MTLIVHAYARGPDGSLRELAEVPTPPRNELAGFESWRSHVYAGPAARALGLRLLPTLAAADIFAEGDDVDLLADDVQRMLAASERWPDVDPEALRFRLLNILEAIRLARTVPGGGVYLG